MNQTFVKKHFKSFPAADKLSDNNSVEEKEDEGGSKSTRKPNSINLKTVHKQNSSFGFVVLGHFVPFFASVPSLELFIGT